MLTGKLISLDIEHKTGKIQQDGNNRIYDFDFSVWDENDKMEVNGEVEFEVEMRIVVKARNKPIPVDPDAIPVTKLPEDCINEFFAHENEVLDNYADFVTSHEVLDFLRMRRFLLTAYNDLCEMDNLIENDKLRNLKNEINHIFMDFEEYVKKAKYTPQYAYEKIFLSRQIEYTKLIRDIEETQSLLNNARSQAQVLGQTLEAEERTLQRMGANNKGGSEYLAQEKEVKSLRKRYVDLIQFIATRQDWLKEQRERIKKFHDSHLNEFISTYTPMLRDIRDRFISLLDSKAYDLDTSLWDRAKQSQSVRKFFRDARIEGGFSSKTFLRYFVRGLDRNKASPKSKELFNLLKYLENISKKSILVLRPSNVDALRCKEIIEKIDSTLSVSVEKSAVNALKGLISNHQDIIVLDEKIGEISALDFIKNTRQIPNLKPILFCVLVKKMPDFETQEKAKKVGVSCFIQDQNMDALFDSVRMML